MLYAVDLSMAADIPTGPLALDVSSDSNISSSEHSNSRGASRSYCWNRLLSSGGTVVLKHKAE